jgi:hypothetical protein
VTYFSGSTGIFPERLKEKECSDLAGLAGEGEAAAVADLDAIEEAARLGQQLQHVRQRQERDVSIVKRGVKLFNKGSVVDS